MYDREDQKKGGENKQKNLKEAEPDKIITNIEEVEKDTIGIW